jgi:hypothetical protein
MPHSRRTGRRAFDSGLIACASVLVLAAPAGATTATFPFTGAQQKFVVPAGVTTVHVLAVGGGGGPGFGPGGGTAGAPAEVSGSVEVFPGQTLYVEVGGTGIGAEVFGSEAFNGGSYGGEGAGGGGGASDVRLAPRPTPDAPASLFSRLIVAGGGGGGGAGKGGTIGGAGGAAGATGGAASTGKGPGGTAGTEEAGGTGCGGLCNGKLGSGTQGSVETAGTKGGGGGGGLFGGGGGESNGMEESGGGGGGGGSSLQPPGGKTVVPATATAPEVQLSYTPPATPSGPQGVKAPPPAPSNGFTVLSPIAGADGSITLVLDIEGPGTLTASATGSRTVTVRRHGRHIRRVARFTYGTARVIRQAGGVLELAIKPSAAGRKVLASHKRLPVSIAVTFAPIGANASTKHASVTLTHR